MIARMFSVFVQKGVEVRTLSRNQKGLLSYETARFRIGCDM